MKIKISIFLGIFFLCTTFTTKESSASNVQLHSPVDTQYSFAWTLLGFPIATETVTLKGCQWLSIPYPWYATDYFVYQCMGVAVEKCNKTSVAAFEPGTSNMVNFDVFLEEKGLVPSGLPPYTPLLQYPILASNDTSIFVGIDLYKLYNAGGISYHFGETYTITNGICENLPGYIIGTSEISYGINGWQTDTPFTGDVYVNAEAGHCVPEPDTIMLIGIGAFGMMGIKYAKCRDAKVA